MYHCALCHSMIMSHNGVAVCSSCLDKEKREKQNIEMEFNIYKRNTEHTIVNLNREIENLKIYLAEAQTTINNLNRGVQ